MINALVAILVIVSFFVLVAIYRISFSEKKGQIQLQATNIFYSKEKRKEVEEKFRKALLEILPKEKIYLHLYDSEEELNKAVYGDTTEDPAAGVYSHLKKEFDSPTNRFAKRLPKIHLTKDFNTFVLAHELGHHFSIEERGDRSEEAADAYIVTLARKTLSVAEQGIIQASLEVYSKTELPELKNAFEDFRNNLVKQKISLYNPSFLWKKFKK